MEPIISFFEELHESFRFVDAIDILLVSLFLYAGLVWFQRTASRGVLIGLAALAVVYFLARGLDMYLTSLAFHTSFAVLLFILVVVFQEDLRRLLERVSTLQSVTFGVQDVSLDLDSLVESVFKMAASRTGALIVLKGKEPLERHLNGGIALNGRISKPLLCSIFDASTPGHDGAVIIQRDLITQFAAHLPISKDTKQIAGRGTRHSAALGLSERSDALTIVVSEERGTVSIAEGGQLEEIATASALKRRLDNYLEAVFPATTQSLRRRYILQHGRLKISSFLIAVAAWFVLAYDPHTVQRTFVAPVEYRNMPKELELELDGAAPSEARITLTGSERDFRFLDPGSLKVSLDLSDINVGDQEVALSGGNLRLPSNVELYRIEPRILRLNVRTRPAKPPDGNGNGKKN